jgi:AraC family transcriptional activator of mtrCDE
MDAVSHVIGLARVTARLDKHCLLGAGTRMEVAAHGALQAPFHVLLEGTCLLYVRSHRIELVPGDVVVIPSGARHRIVTAGGGKARGIAETQGDVFTTTRSERGGEAVLDLFCGHYTFGAGAGAMLFRTLPDPVHVSFGRSAESEGTLRMISALMRGEAQREGDGTAAILSALSTVLLTMVLRTSRGSTTDATLWTAAGDERIANVIEQMLEDPGTHWSIERLSRDAAMSRATFIRRFARSTGMSVGAFLTQLRLMSAAEMLTTTDSTVAAIAAMVGYQSESAFNRSFRSATGLTPGRFRRAAAHTL